MCKHRQKRVSDDTYEFVPKIAVLDLQFTTTQSTEVVDAFRFFFPPNFLSEFRRSSLSGHFSRALDISSVVVIVRIYNYLESNYTLL